MTELINKQSNNHNKIYNTIIVILSIIILLIGYLYLEQIKETDIKIEEVKKTTAEVEVAKSELTNLLVQYDSLMTDNDSINYMLEEQQIKIIGFLKDIKNNKFEKRKYKKEITTLREIMKNYVVQIDSLNTRNQILAEENKEVTQKYIEEKEARAELVEKAQGLEEKVSLASTLYAENITVRPQKKKQRKTRFANKVQSIKICFQIPANNIVISDDINVYIRIARPDELVMAESEFNLFNFEGKEIVYSAMRVIEYNNTIKNDACIFVENNETLIEGSYNIDIFSDGKLIGNSSFSLK